MAIEVNVKKFSNNDPVDFAELNKLVDAVIEIARKMPVTQTSSSSSTGGALQTSLTIANSDVIEKATPIGTDKPAGVLKTIFFKDASGNAISFNQPPLVVASPRSSTAGSGMPVVYVKEVNTSSFTVVGAWTSPRTSTGNIGINYIAVGTVTASSAPNGSSSGSSDSSSYYPTYVAPRGALNSLAI